MSSFLVFSDLDGCLLDHHDYDYFSALTSIRYLANNKIPLIFNSSKNYNEMIAIRKLLNNKDPFIVENGAAIYIPQDFYALVSNKHDYPTRDGYVEIRSQHDQEIEQKIKDLAFNEFHNEIEFFSQMTAYRVSELTGLDLRRSKLAKDRDFSDPMFFSGTAERKQQFISKVNTLGGELVFGGRFIHIEKGYNKGSALLQLQTLFCQQNPLLQSIALGDSQNDESMLLACNIACIIKKYDDTFLKIDRKDDVHYSDFYASKGWHQLIENIVINAN